MAPRKKTPMTDEHKQALAEGRNESRAVKAYLEALQQHRPKRGRKRTPESIAKQLAAINTALIDAAPLQRLQLVQERMDLNVELEGLSSTVDLSSLEKNFIKWAKSYSQRKGISFAAWRELGVPAEVLKAADVGRGS